MAESFEHVFIPSNFGNSKVAPIEEIPRDFFNLSTSVISQVAQNEEIPRGLFNLGDAVIRKVAQNGVLLKGFGVKIVSGCPKFAQN